MILANDLVATCELPCLVLIPGEYVLLCRTLHRKRYGNQDQPGWLVD